MYWYKEGQSDHFKEIVNRHNTLQFKLKKALILYTTLALVGFVVFIFASGYNYIDIPNSCYMKLKYNVTSGNRKSIVEAIKRIKDENYLEYKKVCKFANVIYERECLYANPKTGRVFKAPTEGCYIEGTRSIMIEVRDKYDDAMVEERKEMILEYANIAAEYWYEQK